MRLFESYPPGSALVGAAAALALIGGLKFVIIFSVGVAVGFIAHWLDTYGLTTAEEEVPANVEWFCDFCNPSAQRRTPGDELTTGYMITPLDTTAPSGWFEVRIGDDALPQGGYGCGDCPQSKHYMKVAIHEAGMHDAAMASPERSSVESHWPAHSSPFGAPRV